VSIPEAAPAIAAALVTILALRRLLRRRRRPVHRQEATCGSCGWRGAVSRYAGRCPACNAPMGDRGARPRTRRGR